MPQKPDITRAESAPGEKRRKAMIEAAYSLFTEKGYESVSVDDIIRISGGSKASFYKFFSTKEGILQAVIEEFAQRFLQNMPVRGTPKKEPREALKVLGLHIASLALSENAINQQRLAAGNAKTRPDLGMMWFNHGPKATMDRFAEYLEAETEAGRLKVKNPSRAAMLFLGMLIFKDNMTMLVGAPAPSKRELTENVNDAVEVFLAAYGG